MTARLNNAESVINRNIQRPEKNQSPPRLLLQNQRVKLSLSRTLTTACFCSAFTELIFNSLSFSETIASWWSGWSAPLHDLHRRNTRRFIYPSVNYLSSGTYWPIRYSVAELMEGLKSVRRGCRRFFLFSFDLYGFLRWNVLICRKCWEQILPLRNASSNELSPNFLGNCFLSENAS